MSKSPVHEQKTCSLLPSAHDNKLWKKPNEDFNQQKLDTLQAKYVDTKRKQKVAYDLDLKEQESGVSPLLNSLDNIDSYRLSKKERAKTSIDDRILPTVRDQPSFSVDTSKDQQMPTFFPNKRVKGPRNL
mmetsp:Transcript_18262/g.17384  ORF Transcript_18262/g.17384 Transcript_18262/m.17384 type:complete len:130 (-) Transcript_18262:333-722(-)